MAQRHPELRRKLLALAEALPMNDDGVLTSYAAVREAILAAGRITLEHYAEAMERAGQPAAALGALMLTNSALPLTHVEATAPSQSSPECSDKNEPNAVAVPDKGTL